MSCTLYLLLRLLSYLFQYQYFNNAGSLVLPHRWKCCRPLLPQYAPALGESAPDERNKNCPFHNSLVLVQTLPISLEILKYLSLILHSDLLESEDSCHLSFYTWEVLAFLYRYLSSLSSLLWTEKRTSSSFPIAAIPAVQTVRLASPCNLGILHLLLIFYPYLHKKQPYDSLGTHGAI